MSSRSTILACILATTAVVNGFSPSQHILPPRTPISKLQAATTIINESQYPNLLSQASLCADDESCSIEAANLYLKEIVHYQSGCAAGTLSGNDVCEDVVGVSEVVANLRHKIDNSNGVNKVEKNDRLVESIAFATLYALAAGGQKGVEKSLFNLKNEIERDMKLMGVSNISQLSKKNLKFR